MNQVDLTERGVFQKSSIHTIEECTGILPWYASYVGPKQLREYVNSQREYEKQLIHKEKSVNWIQGQEVLTSSYGWNCKITSSSTTGTYLYHSPSQTSQYHTYQITYNGTDQISVQIPEDYLLKMSTGIPGDVYSITYDKNRNWKLPKETLEDKLQKIREKLWGVRDRPKIEGVVKSKEIQKPYPWYVDNMEELQLDYFQGIFPWYPTYSRNVSSDMVFKAYKDAVERFDQATKFVQGEFNEAFNDLVNILRYPSNYPSVAYLENSELRESFPWELGDRAIIDLPLSDLIEESDKQPSYTDEIRDCLPWMIDMLRDVWRTTISRKLIEDYFKDHWYQITIPELQKKWFNGDTGNPKQNSSSIGLGNSYLTANWNSLNLSIAPTNSITTIGSNRITWTTL